MNDIAGEALRLGVETGYHDALGQWREPDPATLARIVAAVARVAPARPPAVRRGHDGQADDAGDGRPLLVAPGSAYQPDAFRDGGLWMLAVQLYGVRSARNWGIGDFTDLARLLELAAQVGAAGVALNPLHALFAGQASPYSPSSRLHLNAAYIDLERVPGFTEDDVAARSDEIARLRATDLIDHAGVAALKYDALRAAHRRFAADRAAPLRADFAAFKRERGSQLAAFAAFETLRARFGTPWWAWPDDFGRPSLELSLSLAADAPEEMDFHAFVQWQADRQLARCRDLARALRLPIGLYLDVAVGVIPDGADAWSEQDALMRGLSVGAPPDFYNPAGQNWGLASFHPAALIRSDFALLRQTLRASMRYAGAVRLDHVLGLNRVYVVPDGCTASGGTYVRYPFEAMLAVVAQESLAARCLVIGEDLGTVPEGFRDIMADWGIWSYRVALFERGQDGGFIAPEHYPTCALVAFNTHDLPTFAGWLAGHDLKVKHAIGLDPGENEAARADTRKRLHDALAHRGLTGNGDIAFPAIARFCARTNSRLLVIAAEDVLGVVEQPNLPGTIDEHPNWRRKLPVDLEELAKDGRLHALADLLAAEGRARRGA